MRFVLILCLSLGAACTTPPAVGEAEGEDVIDSAYPTLVPLETLTEDADFTLNADVETSVSARAAALQARAARLSQSGGIDESTRTRMDRGVVAQTGS